MHTCIVCGGQTTVGSPICDACRGVSTASPPTTDEKQARLTAVLQAASERAELEAEAGDGSAAELDVGARDGSPVGLAGSARDGSPADAEAGTGVSGSSQPRSTADAGDDETVVLRVIDADSRAVEAPRPQRGDPQADVRSRLIAAFVGTPQGDAATHPVADIEAPAAPTSDTDARTRATSGADARAEATPTSGAEVRAPATDLRRPALDGDGAADTSGARSRRLPGRWRDVRSSLGTWITVAQAALLGVGLLCLVQLVVLLVLDGYLTRAASTGDATRAISAQHRVAGVMLPVLVGLALAATALAAWRVLLDRQDNGASTSWWSMPAGLPLGLWAVLFTASVLLGVAMPGGQATVVAAQRVNQVALVACALLAAACVVAARQLAAGAPSPPPVDQRRDGRLRS